MEIKHNTTCGFLALKIACILIKSSRISSNHSNILSKLKKKPVHMSAWPYQWNSEKYIIFCHGENIIFVSCVISIS